MRSETKKELVVSVLALMALVIVAQLVVPCLAGIILSSALMVNGGTGIGLIGTGTAGGAVAAYKAALIGLTAARVLFFVGVGLGLLGVALV